MRQGSNGTAGSPAEEPGDYVLGNLRFNTKYAVIGHFQAILWRHKELPFFLGQSDAAMVLALLQHHPRAAAKVGAGVKAVYVQQAPRSVNYTGQRCFWLERTDGTSTDFSYRKVRVVPPIPPTNTANATEPPSRAAACTASEACAQDTAHTMSVSLCVPAFPCT
jgi:hypothetical protein